MSDPAAMEREFYRGVLKRRDEWIVELISERDYARSELRTAIGHVKHMGAFIAPLNAGYSFESIGEDMWAMEHAVSHGPLPPNDGAPASTPDASPAHENPSNVEKQA